MSLHFLFSCVHVNRSFKAVTELPKPFILTINNLWRFNVSDLSGCGSEPRYPETQCVQIEESILKARAPPTDCRITGVCFPTSGQVDIYSRNCMLVYTFSDGGLECPQWTDTQQMTQNMQG